METATKDFKSIDQSFIEDLANGKFRFLDLGCGAGRSLSYLERRFGLPKGSGCGADISPSKIEQARAAGNQVVLADVTRTPFPAGCVSFVSMCDFLEHLRTKEAAIEIMERAGSIAKDFIFIRHPSFEDIDYLREFGLKLDWTHWFGHRNMMLIKDYHEIFQSLGWNTYVVIPQKQILDSSHPAIVPISAPLDTRRYDPAAHGPKKLVYFSKPVWTQFDIFVRLNPSMNDEDWRQVIHTFHAPSELQSADAALAKARAKLKESESAILRLEQLG